MSSTWFALTGTVAQADTDVDVAVSDSVSGFDGSNWPAALIVLGVAIVIALVAKQVIHRLVAQHREVLGRFVSRTAAAVIITIGLIYSLSTLGIRVGVLLGALGVGGFALAFAMQDTLSNMISGIILQLRRPFTYSDKVSLNGYEGTVTDINLRSVEMRLLSGEMALIPSSEVLQNPIENWTRRPTRRFSVDVGVSYDADVDHVAELLAEAMGSVDGVLADPPPMVDFAGFGGSSLDFTVYGWFESRHPYFDLRVAAAHAIQQHLAEADIEIPFPIHTLMNPDGTALTDRIADRIADRIPRRSGHGGR
jgi:small-conductance mechanosensitive channel